MNQDIQRTGNPLMVSSQARPMPLAPAAAMTEAMTPKEILGIVRRHMWMIIICTVAGAVLGTGSFFVLKRVCPRYTARAAVEVLPPGEGDPWSFTAGQPQKDTYYQSRFSKAAMVKQQDLMQELIRDPEIRQTNWFKQFAKTDEQGNIIGDVGKATIDAIDDLKKNLSATAPRDYLFIEIAMTCGDAKEAAKITNKMVELFMTSQLDQARSSLSKQLAEQTRQRNDIRTRLDLVESTQAGIRAQTRFARLNLAANQSFRDYMDDKIADIEQSFSSLEGQKSNLEVQMETLKKRAENDQFDDVVQSQIEQDSIARQLRANIAATEPVLAERLTRFGEDHRAVKELRDSLRQMQEEFEKRQAFIGEVVRKADYQQAQDNMAAIAQQMETITRQLTDARTEYREVDQVRAEYDKYEKKREEEQELLKQVTSFIEKLNSQYMDPQISKLRSLGLAPAPLEMSFPRLILFMPGGTMLGLLIGLGLAFAIELLNDLLRTPTDIRRHIRIPLLGTICHADDDEAVDGVNLSHVVRQSPHSMMSENYRQLRTNLKLSGPAGAEHKTLLVTSPAAGDGKTSVAVNLAATLLYEKKKVLLIDANFRRPSTGNLFPRTETNGSILEQHADFGLSNYLMGQCSDEKDIIRASGIENLDIIDSGPLPANPAELADHPRMQLLMERAKQIYDHVIIDGPALLVSDAKILASHVDGTMVVFNASVTHRGAAQRVLRELQSVHANMIGTVLMGVRSRKGGYFQEVYRSYQEYQRVPMHQQQQQ